MSDWENLEIDTMPEVRGYLGDEGPDGDMSWVEKLWNQKEEEEGAKPKNAQAEEEEEEVLGEHLVFEMNESIQSTESCDKKVPENNKKMQAGSIDIAMTTELSDREEKTSAVTSVQKRDGFPDSLLEFTKRSSCIPPAYFGPAFDESCFQCCIRICPVVYNDLVRKDFAPMLARADCVRMSLGSKSTPRLLEIYCQRSAPLLYNLMFCPYSNNTVVIELVRKKPTGWKTVTLKDRVFKVPSVYSSDDSTKAKFQLKSAYFRHNLGKIISVNTRQHVKERSLFISNIPASVDRSLVKQIFPLAGKISWVNASETLRSAVLTMKSRKMVLDHIAAMSEITINKHELKIGAVGLKQEDAEKLLEEPITKHVHGLNSQPCKTEKKDMDSEDTKATSEDSTVTSDDFSENSKIEQGFLKENTMKSVVGTGEIEKASSEHLQNGEWQNKERERIFNEAREKDRLEKERIEQKQQEFLEMERERERQRQQKLEKERSNLCVAKEAPNFGGKETNMDTREIHDMHKGDWKLEDHSCRQRVKRCPLVCDSPLQERRNMEVEMQQEMVVKRQEEEREFRRDKMHGEKKREIHRDWQNKERWVWKEADLQKMEKVCQEEDHPHKEGLLLEERMERMHPEAIHKLRMVDEQHRRERKELQCREQEMAAERVHMQMKIGEECLRQQHKREEWEFVPVSRKRSRFEEPVDKEQVCIKRERRVENLWGKVFMPVGSDRLDSPGNSSTGHLNVQLQASVKRKLELEVARQAEELKKSLALLDKIQKYPSGISASMSEIHSANKGHGSQHQRQSTSFERMQTEYQGSQSPQYEQSLYGSSQDFSIQFRGCVKIPGHFDCLHTGGGQMSTVDAGGYSSQFYGTKDSDIRHSNPPARGTDYCSCQGAGNYSGREGRDTCQHRGGAAHYRKQDLGGSKWVGSSYVGPQRKESGRPCFQQMERHQGRDISQEETDVGYDLTGKLDGNDADQAARPNQRGNADDQMPQDK